MLGHRIINFIKKLITGFLCLFLIFAPAISYATPSDYDFWLTQQLEENVDSAGRTTSARVTAIKRTVVNGSAREVQAVIDYAPKSGAAGRVMYSRLGYFARGAASGGAAIIGAAAVDALLRGIGWIMKDGVYVKKYSSLPSFKYKLAGDNQYFDTIDQANKHVNLNTANYVTISPTPAQMQRIIDTVIKPDIDYQFNAIRFTCSVSALAGTAQCYSSSLTLNLVVRANDSTANDVPITTQELDDIMHGTYSGDPSSNIQPKNDGKWTGVEETFEDDPNAGEGSPDDGKADNEVSKDVQKSLENAPNKTTKDTGTPTKTDSNSETTKADGTKEQTKTDSTTKLPAFCDYALGFCQWMDWTKEDDQDEEEIDKEDLDVSKIPNTTKVSFDKSCPAPLRGTYSMFGRSFTVEYSWQPACDLAVKFKPAVVGCSTLAAIYIVLGINRSRED